MNLSAIITEFLVAQPNIFGQNTLYLYFNNINQVVQTAEHKLSDRSSIIMNPKERDKLNPQSQILRNFPGLLSPKATISETTLKQSRSGKTSVSRFIAANQHASSKTLYPQPPRQPQYLFQAEEEEEPLQRLDTEQQTQLLQRCQLTISDLAEQLKIEKIKVADLEDDLQDKINLEIRNSLLEEERIRLLRENRYLREMLLGLGISRVESEFP